MILHWLISRTVRQASGMRKHVHRLLAQQRDILSPQAIQQIEAAMLELKDAMAGGTDHATLKKQMENLESVANKCLKPYPNSAWRENTEVLLVALSVAMGVRTFFLQPFKIPTGSMQPTLYGVTSEPDYSRSPDPSGLSAVNTNFIIPTGWERVRQWFEGVSYLHVIAKSDGELERVNPPVRFLIFNLYQTLQIGERTYWIVLPPDYGSPKLEQRAGLRIGTMYKKGDDVLRLKVVSGDHLFVDRLTYNFRAPERGEIIVFETRGITRLAPEQQDTFYIKRLVGLAGETVSIRQDHEVSGVPTFGVDAATVPVGTVMIDGKPLSAATQHFENLYAFSGAAGASTPLPYRDNSYFGHALIWLLSPDQNYQIRPDRLWVMGDNTMNSLDSRSWGDFDARNVIGRAFCVYWPVTERFGWGCVGH